MSNIIKQLEQEQMKQDVPSFRPGDTVEVKVWVVEGSKKRLQAFEGVVIAAVCTLHSLFVKFPTAKALSVSSRLTLQLLTALLLNVVVLYVKLNCTTCVSALVSLLVSKSVLTKIRASDILLKRAGRKAGPFLLSPLNHLLGRW